MKTDTTRTPDHAQVIALPPLIYAAFVLLAVGLQWLYPLSMGSRSTWQWTIGAILLTAGALLALWGKLTLDRAKTCVHPGGSTRTIVTTGPYRLSRNPLYLALTLIYLGVTALLNTAWPLILSPLLLWLMHAGVVRREERYLERKFGEEYRRYLRQVRRYL
ncbi:methyltransferase family protein [Microbulbifer guangxiensis]|uniref:methyltransferase family protein n=1 Tax=Microbulbifer guangxiensis TaxID=2904249 RepID=UPI001F37D7E4|nr:isoprenylcysteine carboxylmethyltransferase family protein [Microbulbifer guangxiensis]